MVNVVAGLAAAAALAVGIAWLTRHATRWMFRRRAFDPQASLGGRTRLEFPWEQDAEAFWRIVDQWQAATKAREVGRVEGRRVFERDEHVMNYRGSAGPRSRTAVEVRLDCAGGECSAGIEGWVRNLEPRFSAWPAEMHLEVDPRGGAWTPVQDFGRQTVSHLLVALGRPEIVVRRDPAEEGRSRAG